MGKRIIGEFIKSIPIVVSTALAGSFFVGMFITMPVAIILLSPRVPNRVRIFLNLFGVIIFVLGIIFIVPKNSILVPVLLIAIAVFLFITSLVWRQILDRGKRRFKKFETERLRSILKDGVVSFDRINRVYKNIIERILVSPTNRKKAILMVVVFSIFSFTLLPLGFVKSEFFPPGDSKIIYVSLELPSGTSLPSTKKEGVEVLRKLAKIPYIKYIASDIGRGFNQQEGVGGATTNNVLFTLALLEKKDRPISSQGTIRNSNASSAIWCRINGISAGGWYYQT